MAVEGETTDYVELTEAPEAGEAPEAAVVDVPVKPWDVTGENPPGAA